MVEEFDPPRIQQGQQLAIDVRLRRRRLLDRNAVLGKDLDRPLPRVAVALGPLSRRST